MSVKNDLLRQLFPEGGQVRELASQDAGWCAAASQWIQTSPRPKMDLLKSETERVRAAFATGKRPAVGKPGSRASSLAKGEGRWFAALKDRIRDRVMEGGAA